MTKLRLLFGVGALAVVGAAILAGCGRTGSVTGTVTLDGVPLKDGRIAFVTEDDKDYTSGIKDGAYKVEGVPPGPVTIVIYQERLKFSPPPWPAVPRRYRSARASPLSYDVKRGRQQAPPIELHSDKKEQEQEDRLLRNRLSG